MRRRWHANAVKGVVKVSTSQAAYAMNQSKDTKNRFSQIKDAERTWGACGRRRGGGDPYRS